MCYFLFQAWLEFNLNFPSKLNPSTSLKDSLVFMEPFWDSGVPRFGEKNALGWSSCIGAATTIPDDSAPSDFPEEENFLVKNSSSLPELWIKLENFRQKRFLLPYHGTDEVLDPDRMVLFDDVQPFLFRFSQRTLPKEHLFVGVIANFLITLQCPMLRNFSTESYGWQVGTTSLFEAPLTNLFAYWSESHFSAVSPDSCCVNLLSPYQLSWSDQVCFLFLMELVLILLID